MILIKKKKKNNIRLDAVESRIAQITEAVAEP